MIQVDANQNYETTADENISNSPIYITVKTENRHATLIPQKQKIYSFPIQYVSEDIQDTTMSKIMHHNVDVDYAS